MVSLRFLVLATSLFVSQGSCEPAVAARPVVPTGPIIPVGQFVVPAIIKPLIAQCPPLPPCQPSATCPPPPPLPPLQPLHPTPPSPPAQPCTPVNPTPCIDDDDDEDLDKILYLLINNILENRKNTGKKSGSGKGSNSNKGVDCNNFVDCGDDYEYALPVPYAPASATLYPYGAGAEPAAAPGAGDPGFSIPISGNGYAPEICLTFRPFTDNC